MTLSLARALFADSVTPQMGWDRRWSTLWGKRTTRDEMDVKELVRAHTSVNGRLRVVNKMNCEFARSRAALAVFTLVTRGRIFDVGVKF